MILQPMLLERIIYELSRASNGDKIGVTVQKIQKKQFSKNQDIRPATRRQHPSPAFCPAKMTFFPCRPATQRRQETFVSIFKSQGARKNGLRPAQGLSPGTTCENQNFSAFSFSFPSQNHPKIHPYHK